MTGEIAFPLFECGLTEPTIGWWMDFIASLRQRERDFGMSLLKCCTVRLKMLNGIAIRQMHNTGFLEKDPKLSRC